MQIPKLLCHIWIGPLEAPSQWMKTWPAMNPDWDYRVYDNAFCAKQTFRTQRQIDAYMKRAQYAGAADLIRYELLLAHGGFIAPADSVCVRPVAEIFDTGNLFTVYENEFVRGKLVSPILAATPGHPFVAALIDRLTELSPDKLSDPWKTTGNLFVAKMIEEINPPITIFPSHYLIPEHYTGIVYKGEGPIYAQQYFGSTKQSYIAKAPLRRLIERWKRSNRKRQDAANRIDTGKSP